MEHTFFSGETISLKFLEQKRSQGNEFENNEITTTTPTQIKLTFD